ncbi:MAG: hypothetical protein ABI867_03340 [Kofleriaceae bacterium]
MTTYADPRFLVCALGPELPRLLAAARSFSAATAFVPDEEFSSADADDRMERSFGVCWDTVAANAHDASDEAAVADHGAVMYSLSAQLPQVAALTGAIDAVNFIEHLLDHGATAVKIENAGIAHGALRWHALASDLRRARDAGDRVALARTARIAVTKRPLGGERYYESLGNHMVGLPEVYVPIKAVRTDRDAVRVMEEVADELVIDGLDAVLARRGATLDPVSPYEGDFEFKINPYGIVKLAATPLLPGVRPSRPGL